MKNIVQVVYHKNDLQQIAIQQNVLFFLFFPLQDLTFLFWDIERCSPLKINRRLGGTYHRHLHGRVISQARNQQGAGTPAEMSVSVQQI
jgi:hypothetical protein